MVWEDLCGCLASFFFCSGVVSRIMVMVLCIGRRVYIVVDCVVVSYVLMVMMVVVCCVVTSAFFCGGY